MKKTLFLLFFLAFYISLFGQNGPICGNGVVEPGEACDDGNTASGDGCDSICDVETGYYCSGEPSVCIVSVVGDGIISGAEECDDGNTNNGDGCSDQGLIEPEYMCSGQPSVCTLIPLVPTLGQWGLITLSLSLLIFGVVFRSKKTEVSIKF
jgi:cysteine-rich repeat protein